MQEIKDDPEGIVDGPPAGLKRGRPVRPATGRRSAESSRLPLAPGRRLEREKLEQDLTPPSSSSRLRGGIRRRRLRRRRRRDDDRDDDHRRHRRIGRERRPARRARRPVAVCSPTTSPPRRTRSARRRTRRLTPPSRALASRPRPTTSTRWSPTTSFPRSESDSTRLQGPRRAGGGCRGVPEVPRRHPGRHRRSRDRPSLLGAAEGARIRSRTSTSRRRSSAYPACAE